MSERFIEVFRTEVLSRPRATGVDAADLEPCIGCMVNMANVKLERRCLSEDAAAAEGNNSEHCVNCYCRPMWCMDCMAKW